MPASKASNALADADGPAAAVGFFCCPCTPGAYRVRPITGKKKPKDTAPTSRWSVVRQYRSETRNKREKVGGACGIVWLRDACAKIYIIEEKNTFQAFNVVGCR